MAGCAGQIAEAKRVFPSFENYSWTVSALQKQVHRLDHRLDCRPRGPGSGDGIGEWRLGLGFIDMNGHWVISPQYKWASSFQNGLAAVDRTIDRADINTKGERVLRLPTPADHLCVSVWGDFSKGLTPWPFSEKCGYIDQNGKTMISPQFDQSSGFSEGLAAIITKTAAATISTGPVSSFGGQRNSGTIRKNDYST